MRRELSLLLGQVYAIQHSALRLCSSNYPFNLLLLIFTYLPLLPHGRLQLAFLRLLPVAPHSPADTGCLGPGKAELCHKSHPVWCYVKFPSKGGSRANGWLAEVWA